MLPVLVHSFTLVYTMSSLLSVTFMYFEENDNSFEFIIHVSTETSVIFS